MNDDRRRDGQRGEGKLGGIISLVVFVAFCYAVWNVAPVYIADYSLKDKMLEIARLGRGMNPDEAIMDKLMREVRDESLEEYINKQNFTISTKENSRRIQVEYERVVKILPGWQKTFKFSHDVDQPYF